MREIKFRAYDSDNERMVLNPFGGDDFIDGINDYFTDPDGDPWHIMQYTGLKDKNGVEIYEGDIYKRYYAYKNGVPTAHTIIVVKWKGELNTDYQSGVGFDIESDMTTNEVIGNIYENPDLLKS